TSNDGRRATGCAMKRTLTKLWLSAACLLLAFGSDPGWAQHSGAHSTPSHGAAMPQAGPANAVVEFENESIVVVRIRMAPGEKTRRTAFPGAGWVVWPTDGHLRDPHSEGGRKETHRGGGEMDGGGVQGHGGENLAHEPLEFLAIVPKAGGAAK